MALHRSLAWSAALLLTSVGVRAQPQQSDDQRPAFEEIPIQAEPPEVQPRRPLDEAAEAGARDEAQTDEERKKQSEPTPPPAGESPPQPASPPPRLASPATEPMRSVTLSQPVAEPASRTPLPPACEPQGAYLHDGVYLRLSLGTSFTSLRMTQVDTTAYGFGPSFGISVGANIAERWVLAASAASLGIGTPTLETDQGSTEREDLNLNFAELAAFADFYFAGPEAGWHALGGVGFALAQVVPDTFNASSAPRGGGMVLGFGYDAWIGEQWSVGPLLRTSFGALDDGDNIEFQDQSGRYVVVRLDIGFLHH